MCFCAHAQLEARGGKRWLNLTLTVTLTLLSYDSNVHLELRTLSKLPQFNNSP